MIRNISIQFKAAFLIIVFSLNSIIGFACCLGIDMGCNSNPKDEAAEVTRHIHACCTKYEQEAFHHRKATGGKHNCCIEVLKISQSDKSVPQLLKAINPGFFTSPISYFYSVDILILSRQNINIKYFVRSHHPPIPDIRIAIQRFQV